MGKINCRFEVLAGPSGSGKTYELCRFLLENANRHPEKNYIMIVPDQAANTYEKKLIEMNRKLFDKPGFMNIDVLGFGRLSYKIFQDMGIKDTSVLEEYEKNMLIRVVSGRLAKELEIYGGSVDRMGFTSEIKSLLSELIQYNVTPADLEQVISEPELGSEALIAKLKDVIKIYNSFLEVVGNMESGIAEDRLKKLSDILKSDSECSITDGTTFVFDEYRGYTPDQLSVISALVKRAECMKFSISIEADMVRSGREVKEHDLFYQSYLTLRDLQAAVGFKPEIEYARRSEAASKKRALAHLERNIFRYPSSVYPENVKKDEIDVFFSSNLENEIRYTAEQIRAEVKNGYRYKDIVIVTGDVESFDIYADKIFREYDIPLFSDFNRRLRKNPYAEAIIRMLNILEKDFDYDNVFGFVKTGVLNIYDKYALDSLENYVIRYAIRGSRRWNQNMRPYGREVSESTKKSFERINKVRKRIVETIEPVTRLKGKRQVKEYIEGIRTVMDNLGFESQIDEAAKLLDKEGFMAEAGVMNSLYETLETLLNQTEALLGDEEMNIHDFVEILSSGINEITIGVIPPTIDAVHACDVDRSRIQEAKILHFINVNEGVVPSKKSSGRILSDKDKQYIVKKLEQAGTGKTLASSEFQQSMDSMFRIYQILSKASQKLTVSYITSNEASDSLEPSFVIERITRLYKNLKPEYKEPSLLEGTRDSDRLTYISWVREALESLHGTVEDSGVYKELVKKISKYVYYVQQKDDSEEITDAAEIQPALEFSNMAEDIPNDLMSRIDLSFSVSKIEQYNKCPYAFFMKYILRLMPRPEKKIESYDVGNVIHRALELLFADVKYNNQNDWSGISDDVLTDMMSKYVKAAWDEYDLERNFFMYEEPMGSTDTEAEEESESRDPLGTEGEIEDNEEEKDGKFIEIYNNLQKLGSVAILKLRQQIIAGYFRPDRFEQGFTAEFTARRPHGTHVPVVITGKVDRIDRAFQDLYGEKDVDPENENSKESENVKNKAPENEKMYIRVIDYKTGNKAFKTREIRSGTSLQLLIYTKILCDIFKKMNYETDIIPAGIYYAQVHNQVIDPAGPQLLKKHNGDEEAANAEEMQKHYKLMGVSDRTPMTTLNLHDIGLVSEETGSVLKDSLVIQAGKDKDGNLKGNAVTLEEEELIKLGDYGLISMRNSADKILGGNICKNPLKVDGKKTLCDNCDFKAACRFNEYAGRRRVVPKVELSEANQLKLLVSEVKDEDRIKLRNYRLENDVVIEADEDDEDNFSSDSVE